MDKSHRPVYPKSNFKTAEDWHVYFVYTDDEFIDEVTTINEKHEQWAIDGGEKHSNGIPRFPKSKNHKAQKDWKYIRDKYAVTDFDITFFIQGGLGGGWNEKTMEINDINAMVEQNMGYVFREGEEIVVRLTPFITYQRFHELWSEVMQLKSELSTKSRRRTSENPDLVYAIFKARRENATFSEIFKKYTTGQLDYNGSTSQFNSEDSLERYYDKYRPDR